VLQKTRPALPDSPDRSAPRHPAIVPGGVERGSGRHSGERVGHGEDLAPGDRIGVVRPDLRHMLFDPGEHRVAARRGMLSRRVLIEIRAVVSHQARQDLPAESAFEVSTLVGVSYLARGCRRGC